MNRRRRSQAIEFTFMIGWLSGGFGLVCFVAYKIIYTFLGWIK